VLFRDHGSVTQTLCLPGTMCPDQDEVPLPKQFDSAAELGPGDDAQGHREYSAGITRYTVDLSYEHVFATKYPNADRDDETALRPRSPPGHPPSRLA
jgi:hypothetical protein